MFAFVFGSISAIIMGIIGMFMAIINYPIFKGILGSCKKKYAPEILKLSDRSWRTSDLNIAQ